MAATCSPQETPKLELIAASRKLEDSRAIDFEQVMFAMYNGLIFIILFFTHALLAMSKEIIFQS